MPGPAQGKKNQLTHKVCCFHIYPPSPMSQKHALKFRKTRVGTVFPVSSDHIRTIIADGIPKLGFEITFVRSMAYEKGGCFVSFHSKKQLYRSDWIRGLQKAYGPGHECSVTEEAQGEYKDQLATVKTQGEEIYPTINSRQLPAKRLLTVGPGGVACPTIKEQVRLCIMDLNDPVSGSTSDANHPTLPMETQLMTADEPPAGASSPLLPPPSPTAGKPPPQAESGMPPRPQRGNRPFSRTRLFGVET